MKTLVLVLSLCASYAVTTAFTSPFRTTSSVVKPKTAAFSQQAGLFVQPPPPPSFSRNDKANVLFASSASMPMSESEDDSSSSELKEGIITNNDDDADLTLMQRIRKGFKKQDDGLTFRQRLAKMGLAALLSYGWVSNMSYCVTVSLAWYIFSSQTGLSPLAPGQWKRFLAVYAGFFVFNNFIRPIRLALAVGVSPKFDQFVNGLQNRLKVSRGVAIALTVIIANVIGTTSLMSLGIFIASCVAGVPLFPPKV